MLKEIFRISLTVILIGLGAFTLNTLLQNILTFFNTYLDGMFQFFQYFKELANCEYLIVIGSLLIITVFVSIFVKWKY